MENYRTLQAWFVSDIHLNSLKERNGEILLRFFTSLASKQRPATHLFLLGDIFDFWVADHRYFIEKYKPLIEQIQKIKQQGIEIHFFEGNHDFHLKKYWQEKLGVVVHSDEAFFQLGAYRVRAEHGDLMNPDDLEYLRWRGFVRSSLMKWTSFHIPGRLVSYIGNKLSQASRARHNQNRSFDESQAQKMIRTYAQKLSEDKDFLKDPFDYLITGHIHFRDDYSFENQGRKIHSINLGYWDESPQAYCLNEQGGSFISIVGDER